MQYLRILSNALGQCTAHTLFRNTHPLLKVMQNTRNSTQHHCTSYHMYMKHIQVNVHVHMTSPSVHTTHSVAGGPKARLGVTLNLDGILMYSIVMYMYVSLQEWDLCTIFTSVVSKVCLLVLNCIVPCHVCQTRGVLNSQ